MELVTCDTILQWIKVQVEHKVPIDPLLFLDAAEKLNILKSDETDKLFQLQQEIAALKVVLIEEGKSVAEAKTRIEASDIYRIMRTQEAKVKLIEEQIRLSKKRAQLKSDEMRSGL